ncbi:hypothetical protein AO958_23340 [Pseudomonas aeruginosa]|nr:hypothetical protein [Pseudomonas aeruginosa]KSH06168.1 hypothetical protein AO958_23340 [Pseudomonas aeruginosa]MDI2706791.1 hypothetical protein [Pseudomonas aeruginosa]
MERIEARILLKNLLRRIKPLESQQFELPGILTEGELDALKYAYALFDDSSQVALDQPGVLVGDMRDAHATSVIIPEAEAEAEAEADLGGLAVGAEEEAAGRRIELDLSVFALPEAPDDARLCLDFGTAMSKATLVIDAGDYEEIHVLDLGIPGDQPEVSETMLISSVYIDNNGILRFGKSAVDFSLEEGGEGERMRVDNVKRYLSEDALHSPVPVAYNPTGIVIAFGDLLLAYLTFMTWAVSECLASHDMPRNLKRRFAMPCFEQEKSRAVAARLRVLLGEAQVLADTFGERLQSGLPLEEFIAAVQLLQAERRNYAFVTENLTEPLGVANALLSSAGSTNSLTLVVDVGAGTSDMSLYRLQSNPSTPVRQAVEVNGSARGIIRAGNYLDQALIHLLLNKAGIGSDHPRKANIQRDLSLRMRDYKEALFNDGFLTVRLLDGALVEVTLQEFMELKTVLKFAEDLEQCLRDVLANVDASWIQVAQRSGGLAVVLTGGGAKLPMVKALASGQIEVSGQSVRRIHAPDFPLWLREEYPELEDDFPRIAVSLGGARKSLIALHGKARVTAGDVTGRPVLTGFYSR